MCEHRRVLGGICSRILEVPTAYRNTRVPGSRASTYLAVQPEYVLVVRSRHHNIYYDSWMLSCGGVHALVDAVARGVALLRAGVASI